MTDTSHLAAVVIASARAEFARAGEGGTPAFDYRIACGQDFAEQLLSNEIYWLANRDHPYPGGGAEAREARAADLARELAGELDAYRARCRSRKYTGWSYASTGPIRYA